MSDLPTNQPCPHCGRYNNRAVSIDAIIVNEKGQVLLIKRGAEPFKGYWGTPGGHIDWNESGEEAVKREVKEETGLTIQTTRFLKVYSDPKRHPKQTINISYIAEATGEPKAGDDAADIKWFDINNLPKPLAFDHETVIEDYLKTR